MKLRITGKVSVMGAFPIIDSFLVTANFRGTELDYHEVLPNLALRR
ncbi:hypothetical protein [Lacticaseibacillus hulanensis]|nr:hypothetical protein [Lacticaseibacillus hulanensis]